MEGLGTSDWEQQIVHVHRTFPVPALARKNGNEHMAKLDLGHGDVDLTLRNGVIISVKGTQDELRAVLEEKQQHMPQEFAHLAELPPSENLALAALKILANNLDRILLNSGRGNHSIVKIVKGVAHRLGLASFVTINPPQESDQ